MKTHSNKQKQKKTYHIAYRSIHCSALFVGPVFRSPAYGFMNVNIHSAPTPPPSHQHRFHSTSLRKHLKAEIAMRLMNNGSRPSRLRSTCREGGGRQLSSRRHPANAKKVGWPLAIPMHWCLNAVLIRI